MLTIIPIRALQRWPGSVDDNDLCCLQGMSLVPAVTELLLAELLYLQYDNPTRPIFMYINSAGVQVRSYGHACSARVFSKWASLKAVTEQTVVFEVAMEQRLAAAERLRVDVQKGGDKLGYESEAFAIYDTMKYIKPEVHTLCVGTAFGESAMLLAAGTPVQFHPCHGRSLVSRAVLVARSCFCIVLPHNPSLALCGI